MLAVKILGTGLYVPGEKISNAELKQITGLEFKSDKLEEKLGVFSRHMAHLRGIAETTADFATKAAQNAISDAGLSGDDIGLFIVGTDTPEYISPATAILVQGRIQKQETWASAFDISASCASFTIALDNAVRIMATDPAINYAVVTGVYNMPAYLRPDDAFGYSLFADGAGAVVLARTDNEKQGYIGSQLLTDGTQFDFIGVYAGGTKMPVTRDVLDNNQQGLLSLQPMPGDRNVRLWPMVVRKLLDKYKLSVSEIDHFIFTQINHSVINDVMNVLGVSMSKTTTVMDKYGYTGSGCVPMAFHHAVKEGRIKRGDRVLFMASGAGLAVGSNLFIY
ncbi:MAG: ketoacyl-ACP synthase III [Lentimicrobiaceae bacterium]|nr:ketoacyl-ACP synthase III [Lentimicrobiaceae bacterium]MCB9023255.1 ketoacyl-ACP synthase III [Lentimicrobiaceae bacterium]MCO5266934.1 ketoacyl-ACP synthase III [Lentimicrobium sp.]